MRAGAGPRHRRNASLINPSAEENMSQALKGIRVIDITLSFDP